MVSLITWLSEPYGLAAPMVIGKAPSTMGGPEMIPVAGSKLSPAGSTLQLNETG